MKKLQLISLDGNGLNGFLALPSGGGGSFEPEIPPKQQQILPFAAIKEINTIPLGRAPSFRVHKFYEKNTYFILNFTEV
jgi:hypothetical protein